MRDEVLSPELCDLDRLVFGSRGEWMVGRKRDDQAVLPDGLDVQTACLHGHAEQGQVDVARLQCRHLFGREHLAPDADIHIRQLVAQCAHEAREQRVGRRPDAADREVALPAVGDALCAAGGGVDGVEDRDRLPEIVLAGGGQFDAPRRPDEQCDAEFVLELADLLGQRRLGDVQTLSRAAEVQFLGDRAEVPQVAQLHAGHPTD